MKINKEKLINEYIDGLKIGTETTVLHKERGTEYVVEMVVKDATNNNDGGYIVIYREVMTVTKRWAREIDEFCDGRFIII